MLVLSRNPGESVLIEKATISDQIIVTLVRIGASKARIGITAPESVRVLRPELIDSTPVLLPEDRSCDPVIRRLRLLNPEHRQDVIRKIVGEFCGSETSRRPVSAGV